MTDHPAPADLRVLAGAWTMELSGASFLPDPQTVVSGPVTLDWIEDGHRAGDVFGTYFTSGRGVEALGSVWTFLDLTLLGHQETREDLPVGWPQSPPYQRWRRHDEYEKASAR
jgi:Bacterial protein of unknown function (DUF899)